ncbi:MAG: T9SS type A sorting domain-containing protein [Bacteroidota bacterium]
MIRIFWMIFLLVGVLAGIPAQTPTFFKRIDFDGQQEGAVSIIPADSGYIISGNGYIPLDSGIVSYGLRIAKVDDTGESIWQRGYAKAGEEWYNGLWGNLIRTNDGGYVFGGTIRDTAGFFENLIIKFSEQGDTLWSRRYRQIGISQLHDVVETPDSGLAFSGYIRFPDNQGREDYLLLKTDQEGHRLWQRTYGGPFNDIGITINQTLDEGFMLAGGKDNLLSRNSTRGWLIKTDSLGQTEWDREYYGNPNKDNCGSYLYAIEGGEYYMLNCHDTTLIPFNQPFQFFISRISIQGDEIWRTYLSTNFFTMPASLEVLADSSVIIIGYQASSPGAQAHLWLEKLNPQGQRLWERRYVFSDSSRIGFNGTDLIEAFDGSLLITGFTFEVNQDMFLLKLDSNGCFEPDCDSLVSSEELLPISVHNLQVWPNPTSENLHINYCGVQIGKHVKISMINGSGQQLLEDTIRPNGNCLKRTLEVSHLPKGIYVLTLTQEGRWLGRRRLNLH